MAKSNVKLAIIRWDQKVGGVLEAQYPNFDIGDQQCMNIYSLHRMRKTEPSIAHFKVEADKLNQLSIFSGFGEGGYGGTGGTTHVGVPERVLSIMLPMNWNTREFERVAVFLFSRVLLFRHDFASGLKGIGKVIASCKQERDPAALLAHLQERLDSALKLSPDQQIRARDFETKLLYYWIQDLKEDIEDMRLRPASTAGGGQTQKLIDDLKKKEETIAQLTKQIVEFTMQGSQAEIDTSLDEQLQQKDARIQQMQMDYVEIFGKLTEQLNQQQEEINAISESTQAFVNDLNAALRQKIQQVQDLKEQLQHKEMELTHLRQGRP